LPAEPLQLEPVPLVVASPDAQVSLLVTMNPARMKMKTLPEARRPGAPE
jgi:hypothetical protein